MEKKICRYCGTQFPPSRATQQYCSVTCSRRQRDRKWRERNHTQAAHKLRAQLADVVVEDRRRLGTVTRNFHRQLEIAEQNARTQLEVQANRHDRDTETLHARLRDLATINVDLSCEIPELKAQVTELQLEVARLLHGQRADAQEFMQISGRLFELSARLGLPLDKATKEIFEHHGWRTNTLVQQQ